MSSLDKRVVRIVKEAGVLPEEEAASILAEARTEQCSVPALLIKKGLVDENELLGLISHRLRVTPVNLHDLVLDQEVVRTIPEATAVAHHTSRPPGRRSGDRSVARRLRVKVGTPDDHHGRSPGF